MSLDQSGQLHGQLIQISDVHKGITVNALDILFVISDGRCDQQDSFTATPHKEKI